MKDVNQLGRSCRFRDTWAALRWGVDGMSAAMTDLSHSKRRHAFFLPHDSEELQGHAPPDARTPRLALENADLAIRQVLLQQKREESRMKLPPIAPPSPVEREETPLVGFDYLQQLSRVMKEGLFSSDPMEKTASRRSLCFRGFGLTRRNVVLLALAGLVIWWPLQLPSILGVIMALLVVACLIFGPDRFAKIAGKGWQRFATRRPERAARLRQHADSLALFWDKLLDWLPERWANRLSLPDFSGTEEYRANLDEAPDPFDRQAARYRRDSAQV